MSKPLKIGLSPRFRHPSLLEQGFRGKTLQYLEQSMAHWLMTAGALVFMVPSLGSDSPMRRGTIRIADYVDELDGLVLQGGADVCPLTYGETPLKPEWNGDRARDHYEIDLFQEFVAHGKPVLGVCRGVQLINVAFGGTLYQDIVTQVAGAHRHYDPDAYDQLFHDVSIVAGTGLAKLYSARSSARVNSIHHQAIKDLGDGLTVEALSALDGVIEAVRWNGPSYVFGVQWHPEFLDPDDGELLDRKPLLAEFLEEARKGRRKLFSKAGSRL